MKKFWKLLNGNKTIIGMTIMLVAQGFKAFVPDLLTEEQLSFIQGVGSLIGGVGLIHKGVKNDTFNKTINSIKSNNNVRI